MPESREFKVTVLRGGQITIPRDVREELNILPEKKITVKILEVKD